MRLSVLGLFLVGCYGVADFVPEKTTVFCEAVLACTDPAVLTFDGLTETTCQAAYGPQFRDEGEGCKFRRRAAKQCISDLEALVASCPDGPVQDNLPASCDTVFDRCTGAPPDTDEPVDTDPIEETGE